MIQIQKLQKSDSLDIEKNFDGNNNRVVVLITITAIFTLLSDVFFLIFCH